MARRVLDSGGSNMAYSNIAATVNDYALTEAKRSGAEKIGELHLLLAVRTCRPERFESEYPGLGSELESAVAQIKGRSLKPDGYISDLGSRLEAVKTEEALWELTARVVDEYRPMLENTDGPVKQQEAEDAGQVELANTHGDSRETQERTSDEVPTSWETSGFPLTLELVTRVAQALDDDTDQVLAAVTADSLWICNHVASGSLETMGDSLADVAELDLTSSEPGGQLGVLISRLVSASSDSGPTLARELAVAYVGVATWAAASDSEIADDEIAKIDELRLRFRAELSQGNAPVDSTIGHFDETFEHLVGMEEVKTELRKRIDFLVVNQRRMSRGFKATPQSLHMAFLGNPGTGKTVVARLYAEVLRKMGLLSRGQVVEVDRSGLVGQYVGHTEKKTLDVVKKALGGVLFIDEAYAIANDANGQNGYGQEIIDVLVKQLEDHRHDLVVIFAGYEQPMARFFATNEGLRSRVPAMVHFADFTSGELTAIAERMAMTDGYTLSEIAADRLGAESERLRGQDGFGNARTVRNLYEEALRNQSARIAGLGDLATQAELREISEEDIPMVEITAKPVIGFAR